ncbi:acyl carrier protein [Methylohalomonas lacus]|uniref:Acyl carrier protein n=1 Tax=Methylohalomonas lacus TaxID=398773 RepID=A0AAE3HN15_9GAMM|nr:acyl carrier protein [Methylohalomonas lacus]MCS3904398.1 acyl carrier protein [Methylohalomonas lacus]
MKENFKSVVSSFLGKSVTDDDLELPLDQFDLDSLEAMELIMQLEEKLDGSLDTSDLPIDCTLNHLYQRIHK